MRRKNVFPIVILVLIVIASTLAGASAPVANNAWILLPDTEILSSPSYSSSVVYTCRQNEEVVLEGEPMVDVNGIVWRRVCYNDTYTGYVPQDMLYFTTRSTTESVRVVKISPEKMGAMVPLYRVIGEDAAIELADGTNVVLLETTADYNDYSVVEYEGQKYFILTKYITDTLTYNQKIAIIIAVAIVGIVVSAVVVLSMYRKKVLNK